MYKFKIKFTNGESKEFLASSYNTASVAAYAWLCAYRADNVHIHNIGLVYETSAEPTHTNHSPELPR